MALPLVVHGRDNLPYDDMRAFYLNEVLRALLACHVVSCKQERDLRQEVRTSGRERGEDPHEVLQHQLGADVAVAFAVRGD